MLVPTSVTTRLTSRLAVSFPTLGPPTPLHRDACSILKTVMNAFTSRPDLHPAEQGERNNAGRDRGEGPLVETFRREILTERSPGKVGPSEFAPPERIVFARIGVDGFRGTSVDGRVRLAVTDEAGSPDPDAAFHRLLEDRRRDFAASPFDRLQQGDVHGDDAHGIRPHRFLHIGR